MRKETDWERLEHVLHHGLGQKPSRHSSVGKKQPWNSPTNCPHLLAGPRIGWQPIAAINYSLRSSVWVTSSLGGSTYHRPHLTYWLFEADLSCGEKVEVKTKFTVENPWSHCHAKCHIFLGSIHVSCSSIEHVALLYAITTAWGNHTLYLHSPLAA